MKRSHTVKWSATAEKDLKRIVDRISRDSIQNAIKVLEKIQGEAEQLFHFPERGRIVPEFEAQNLFFFRELIVSPWRIIYSISNDCVHLLAVIDSRQNFEDILLKKILRAGDV